MENEHKASTTDLCRLPRYPQDQLVCETKIKHLSLQDASMAYSLKVASSGNLPFCLFQRDLQAGAGLASPHQDVVGGCTNDKGHR